MALKTPSFLASDVARDSAKNFFSGLGMHGNALLGVVDSAKEIHDGSRKQTRPYGLLGSRRRELGKARGQEERSLINGDDRTHGRTPSAPVGETKMATLERKPPRKKRKMIQVTVRFFAPEHAALKNRSGHDGRSMDKQLRQWALEKLGIGDAVQSPAG